MRVAFSIIFLSFLLRGHAVDLVKVRILSNIKLQSFFFQPDKGCSYTLFGDGKIVYVVHDSESIQINLKVDSLEVKKMGAIIGVFHHLKLNGATVKNSFRLKCINPERKNRYYQDNLVIVKDINNSGLRIINCVELDKYIAGVVEAEAGRKSHNEFYKAQSILARTYALSIIGKHVSEGHDLCDQVHCQAFFGRTSNFQILEAVNNTKGLVVVDQDLNLINAVFHSNSGGQTANAEDVWGRPASYLKAVNDTFSVQMPNFSWQRKMSTEDWLTYLKIKHRYPVEDSSAKSFALNFKQEKRKVNLEYDNIRIPLKSIRTDLSLRSTYFSISVLNDSVIFNGRGYGHGIGMCQEGAMKMTEKGYSYEEVIRFYYRGVKLIDRSQLTFFKED